MIVNALHFEIHDLHHFFEAWFRGDVPDDDNASARLEGALAHDFTMVTPDGDVLDRRAVLETVRSAYGTGGRNIRVEQVELLDSTADRMTAAYEEWQERDGEVTARRSTVVFAVDFNAPNGLRWLRVHETWMEPSIVVRH